MSLPKSIYKIKKQQKSIITANSTINISSMLKFMVLKSLKYLKNMRSNRLFTTIVSLILFWIFAAAELNSMHFDPQPQFWTEACVAWGVLVLGLICIINLPKISLPFIAFPLILFCGYIGLQPEIIHNVIGYNGINYIVVSEMLLCVIMAMIINSLKIELGETTIVSIVAYILFIGAILQSFIGMAQYMGIAHKFGDIIFYDGNHPTTNIFGHFGQRNHYAHYLSWGTFSLVYLYSKRKLPSIAFYSFLAWLCFALTLSASRSVFIYFGLASIISIFSLLFNRSSENRFFVKIIIIASIALFAMEYVYPIIVKMFSHTNGFSSGLSRIEGEQGTGRRSVEWQKALMVFKDYPIWGIGWGGFARESVYLHPLFPNAALNSGLFTNCHNLILQLLAETGAIGTAIFVVGVLISLLRRIIFNVSIETLLILCLVGTTMSHSMNEYPLWYIYFLLGFITFLSFDKPVIEFSGNPIRIVFMLLIVTLGTLLAINSVKFDRLVAYFDAPDNQKQFNHQLSYLEKANQKDVFLQYYDDFVLDNYINVDTDYTDDYMSVESQYEYTKRFVSYHPYPDTMIKMAMLDYTIGETKQAESMVELACNAFPVYKKSFKNTLSDPYYKDLLNLVK